MESYDNFLGLEPNFSDISNSRYVIASIPFDKACSWNRGASKGPAAIVEASKQVELFDVEFQNEAFVNGVFTAPALECETSAEMVDKGTSYVADYLRRDKFVFTLGGDHSISLGPIRAHASKFSGMSVLHIDAHLDRRAEYDGNKYSHASIIARVSEFIPNIVSVGIRSGDREESKGLDHSKVVYAHQIQTEPGWLERVMSQLSDTVYITLDVDAFDIGIMPSTGTPEPGGMSWYEVLGLIRGVIEKKRLVGMDIVELLPRNENPAPDFLVAKLMYKVINLHSQKMGWLA